VTFITKFPEKLKEAQVVPCYKKSNALDKSNYRPVSILPVIIYVDLKRFSSFQLSSKEQFDTHIQNGKQISKGEKFY
jgi:hypothetical protein